MAEKEYISRNAFRQQLIHRQITAQYVNARERHEIGCIIEMLDKAPTADVAPVVHASWKWGYMCGHYGIWCTNCGGGWTNSENAEWIAHEHDYCGKCGAKMDGGEHE